MVREEWCSGNNIWHEVGWIPALALIGTGMWPWPSLGLIFRMGIIVIIFYTVIVKMICDNRLRCPAPAWYTVGHSGMSFPLHEHWPAHGTFTHDMVTRSCPLGKQRAWQVCEHPMGTES